MHVKFVLFSLTILKHYQLHLHQLLLQPKEVLLLTLSGLEQEPFRDHSFLLKTNYSVVVYSIILALASDVVKQKWTSFSCFPVLCFVTLLQEYDEKELT